MGFVLDAILKERIVTGPETVNVDFNSPSFDISKTENDFTVTFVYENGSTVNMNIYLQVSTDNITFVDVDNSGQNITDDDGTHIWDVASSGAGFARVRVAVTAGSIDISEIMFSGKRRH